MRQMSLAIVGVDYPNKRGPGRRFELALCGPGEPIELRPEPKNPHDEHAVAVYSCRGVQLGYLTAERAPWIGGMLKQGQEVAAVYQGVGSTSAWARVAFDGEVPTLPERALTGESGDDGEDGFWPDPIYDD